MTAPREWPNNAAHARDQAAEEAVEAIRALQAVLEKDLPREEMIRKIARAAISCQVIARLLEGVGAPTRPN